MEAVASAKRFLVYVLVRQPIVMSNTRMPMYTMMKLQTARRTQICMRSLCLCLSTRRCARLVNAVRSASRHERPRREVLHKMQRKTAERSNMNDTTVVWI